jgi:hypothetical protein
MLLTSDPAATDPACSLSPAHGVVDLAVSQAHTTQEHINEHPKYLYRIDPLPAPPVANPFH